MAAESNTDPQVLFSAGSIAEGYRTYLEPVIFGPWAQRLLDVARLQPGQRLLDVACGTGVVARSAAPRLGPGGHVIASDISPGMLAHVPVGFPSGAASVDLLEAPATALPLPDGSVDAVTCQQGLPFISDRPAAAREMRRVLRPGGIVAVAVWHADARLEPFATYAETLLEHGAVEPYPHAYDLTRYAMSPDAVTSALEDGGLIDVEIRVEQLLLDWPDSRTAALGISATPFYPAVTALDETDQQTLYTSLVERMTGPDGGPARHVTTAVLARGTAP